MALTDLSDMAVTERFALMKRRRRRRWYVAAGVALLMGLAALTPVALKVAHHWWKVQRVEGYDTLIQQHAKEAGLSVPLVEAVVLAESGGNPAALSPRQAKGLMQITAVTERDVLQRNDDLTAGDLFDPDYNLRIGTTYLAQMLERFDGDLTLALAAYHMGPTAVRRLQRAHPQLGPTQLVEQHAGPQTRAYVRTVLRNLDEARALHLTSGVDAAELGGE